MEGLVGLVILVWLFYATFKREPKPPGATRPARSSPSPRPPPPRPPPPPKPRPAPKAPSPPPTAVRTEPLLACLAYLRHEIGAEWSGILDPFAVNPKDAVDVNRAVNRLAAHVGLTGLRFVVAIGRLQPKHGGLIELERDKEEVFIDVATSAGAFGPSLLAVLAHEVTHKVLFDRRMHALDDDTLRYEILTDVTAAYLGFGKLMLNGYTYRSTRQDYAAGTVHTKHVRFGYLSVEEVAFVHTMACRIREATPHDPLGRLSPFATRVLQGITNDPSLGQHFRDAPRLVPRSTYLRHPEQSRPIRTNPRQTQQPRESKTPSPARPPPPPPPPPIVKPAQPANHPLHQRLVELVYGDERQARRLVAYEQQRRQLTLEKSYEAAIERLIRDRS